MQLSRLIRFGPQSRKNLERTAETLGKHASRNAQLIEGNFRSMQAALAHAQFETIHPFPDGNGRVGRALIQAMLRGGQLTRNVAVPVSAGLPHDTGRILVEDLETVRLEWRERVTATRDSAAYRLVDVLLRQPVIDSAAAATQLGISAVNAQVAINRLVNADALTQISDGRRSRIWLAKDVVRVLDEFAARSKRRR